MVEIRVVEYNLSNATEYGEDTRNEKALDCGDWDIVATVDSDNVYSEEVFNAISGYKSNITFYGYRDKDTCTVYYAVYTDEIASYYEDVVYAEWAEISMEDDEYYDDTCVPNYINWEDM